MSRGGEIWNKPQKEGEELRNLKKIQKGSARQRKMEAYRNEVFKHSNVGKRKQAPKKLEN